MLEALFFFTKLIVALFFVNSIVFRKSMSAVQTHQQMENYCKLTYHYKIELTTLRMVRPLSESSSHIHLGYRKTISSSDMVVPFICGILPILLIHIFTLIKNILSIIIAHIKMA